MFANAQAYGKMNLYFLLATLMKNRTKFFTTLKWCCFFLLERFTRRKIRIRKPRSSLSFYVTKYVCFRSRKKLKKLPTEFGTIVVKLKCGSFDVSL